VNEPSHAFVLFELSKLHSNNVISQGAVEVAEDIAEAEFLSDVYKVEVEIDDWIVAFDEICSINFILKLSKPMYVDGLFNNSFSNTISTFFFFMIFNVIFN
jgi:hypothetical protein